jgi:HK97 family phage prohead protease
MSDGPELLRIGVDGVVPVQWSVEKSDDPGSLTGWASVYNVVDQQDDVVAPGAFRKTLAEWRASNRVIPLTLDHQNTAEGVIGSVAKIEDTAYGLRTTFRFSATSKAQDARTKAREGHLNGLSIWGPIFDKSFDTFAGKSVRMLRSVGLAFVGLTPMPANTGALVLTAKATDTAWDGSAARFSPQQWARACLIDTGEGDTASKARYKLPVKEPDGMVNRNAVHAAVAALAGGRGGVDASAEQKASAARALVRMYGEMDEEAPESVRRMAEMMSASLSPEWAADMRAALSLANPAASKAAVDLLVRDQYTVSDITIIEPPATEPETETTPAGDDPSDYALGIAGMTGPDVPPGGEPTGSLVDSLASADAAQIKSDLDAFEASLTKETE